MNPIFHKELVIDYSGPINFDIKKELIALLKEKIEIYVKDQGRIKRCAYVFEELLTNAHEYYKLRTLPDEPIQVTLELVNKTVIDVCISNTILKPDMEKLLTKIDVVNTGDKSALQELFYKTLNNDAIDSVGGGVGLLTVKLKSGFSYTFELVEKNKNQNLFCLTTSIHISGKAE
jgi:hypothetical protein